LKKENFLCKNSFLNKVLGSAKGVIVPHELVKSIGDVLLISKSAVPSYGPEDEEEEKGNELKVFQEKKGAWFAVAQEAPENQLFQPVFRARFTGTKRNLFQDAGQALFRERAIFNAENGEQEQHGEGHETENHVKGRECDTNLRGKGTGFGSPIFSL